MEKKPVPLSKKNKIQKFTMLPRAVSCIEFCVRLFLFWSVTLSLFDTLPCMKAGVCVLSEY